MMIKCVLTDSKDYKQFVCNDNSTYTLKISKCYDYWCYDLCDLIEFYAETEIQVIIDADDSDIALARRLYGQHNFNESFLRDYEADVMVHSTTKENVKSILKDNAIKSWNILKAEKRNWEDKPIGHMLGDIEDFSNYVMLSQINYNNEVVTASKANNKINTDCNQTYTAGARFYLDAGKLANDGLLLRDGEHIKVKNSIDLEKYLIWYCTPEKLGINEITTPEEFYSLSNNRFKEIFERK